MAERALRGARLGAQSFEDERGVEMAPRQQVRYVCADGHTFSVTMADEAEVPVVVRATDHDRIVTSRRTVYPAATLSIP